MISPDFLKEGDLIRIVSPAGKVKEEKVLPAVDLLRQSGFDVVLGRHVFDQHFQFAGTEAQRLRDLQQALDDPDCKAIICSRGGYGAIHIVEKLDFTAFRKNPKWLVGFSDVTLLHAQFQHEGFCSIHGAMPAYYLNEGQPTESFTQLIKVLTGEKLRIKISVNKLNRSGNAEGLLIGGNLSILYSMLGTPFEPDFDGKILFIEDLSEYLYHLDRMMYSLKLSGKLKKLKGLVVGGFTEMKDNDSPFGQTVDEIIMNAVKEYNFPVCFDFPAGHMDRNLPLVLGAAYSIEVGEKQVLVRHLV
jgi:muramoyltetrapeptide carboxypeptidase